ncbi:hypothetical protein BH10BDE1_BH10BDE1_32130 [soil metagenome]
MRVISTNVGKPSSYEFGGVTLRSSMRRQPTLDGLHVFFDHVVGDKFAVPNYHGIKEAVVYAFSSATFPALSDLLTQDVGVGNVGENLTMDELLESELMIGDEYEIGETRLKVSGPRYPCNHLNFCFQRATALEIFAKFRRPGVYFEVLNEGVIRRDDELTLVKQAGGDLSVLELFDALRALKDLSAGRSTLDDLKPIAVRVLNNNFVPEFHRVRFQKFATSLS